MWPASEQLPFYRFPFGNFMIESFGGVEQLNFWTTFDAFLLVPLGG